MPGTEEVPDVDHGTTASSRAPWAALPERPDRRRVDAGRALHPAGRARRPSAHGGRARGAERAPLRAGDRLPVARPAQGSAAEEHGPRLSHALGLGRHAEAAAPRLVRPGPRAGRQGGEPDGSHHRQPECQERGKRGAHIDPSGYDAGKKVKGKKRHILVDTLGLLLSAAIHPADVQDRDGATPLLRAARRLFPFVEVIFADGAYRGEATAAAVAGTGRRRLEIVGRGDAEGFVLLPRRGVVLPCTMLPWPAGAISAFAPRGWRDAKDDLDLPMIDLDLPMIDLDPTDHQPDDLASGGPIEQVEAFADLGREVLQAPDHQGEVAPRLGGGRQRRAVFLHLGDAGPQVGQTRLELRAFDDAVGIAVDQPPDPAPHRADATLDLAHIRIRRRARQAREAALVLVGDSLRVVQDGLDLGPHGALEVIAAHRAIAADRLAVEPVAIAADTTVGAVAERAGAMAFRQPGRGLAVIGVAAPPTHDQALEQPPRSPTLLPLAPAVLRGRPPGGRGGPLAGIALVDVGQRDVLAGGVLDRLGQLGHRRAVVRIRPAGAALCRPHELRGSPLRLV